MDYLIIWAATLNIYMLSLKERDDFDCGAMTGAGWVAVMATVGVWVS